MTTSLRYGYKLILAIFEKRGMEALLNDSIRLRVALF